MVQKYQKKPVVIEAIQFNGLNPTEIKDFVGDKCEIEYIGEEAHKLGQAPMAARITIHTLEGDMSVSVNDYVIKGVKGEFYPCKPDIFLDTYTSCNYNPTTMACKLKTYWVEYSIDYEFYDHYYAKWQKEHWYDADRFKCRKRDIKNEVHKRLHEELFLDGSERNVVITINDCYETTECEV